MRKPSHTRRFLNDFILFMSLLSPPDLEIIKAKSNHLAWLPLLKSAREIKPVMRGIEKILGHRKCAMVCSRGLVASTRKRTFASRTLWRRGRME